MKVKIFWGCVAEAQDAFNKWAEGKALSRDVIIHELVIRQASDLERASIAIIVYHPEGAIWDSTKSKPISRVQPEANKGTGLEHKDEPQPSYVVSSEAGKDTEGEQIAVTP